MQIPPSNSLLQALSGHQSPAASGVRSPKQTDAARAAARAVFSQLKAPSAPAPASGSANQVAAPVTAQAIPATPPNRPLPRGSIINILV